MKTRGKRSSRRPRNKSLRWDTTTKPVYPMAEWFEKPDIRFDHLKGRNSARLIAQSFLGSRRNSRVRSFQLSQRQVAIPNECQYLHSMIELRIHIARVADRYFSADEVRELYALTEAERRLRFLEYWTLRESYVKARGLAIAMALRKLSFRLGPDEIAVKLDPALGDDPTHWQFELFRPTATHVLAVAGRKQEGEKLSIRLRGG